MADGQDVSADEEWDLLSPGDETPGETGADEPEERPRRSLRHLFVGGAVALLLVLAISTGPTLWRILQQKNATIGTPASIAGLTLDTGDSAANTTDNLRSALSAGVNLDRTVAAVYTEGGDTKRSVIFFGGTGLVWSPSKELDDLFDLLADATGGVRRINDIPAGKLGGVMRCGVTSFDQGEIPVCGWADHGSVALALFLDRAIGEAGTLMGQMRAAMEKRR